MMHCKSCQKSLLDNFSFCPFCGYKLNKKGIKEYPQKREEGINPIIERLLIFIEKQGLSQSRVIQQSGLPSGIISHSKRKKTGFMTDTIIKILIAYPDLNANWLLLGNGEMLLSTEIE
jgi:hypothetical protein